MFLLDPILEVDSKFLYPRTSAKRGIERLTAPRL